MVELVRYKPMKGQVVNKNERIREPNNALTGKQDGGGVRRGELLHCTASHVTKVKTLILCCTQVPSSMIEL